MSMKRFLLINLFCWAILNLAFSQCKIAIDTLDEFDTSRLIATKPIVLGYLVPTDNAVKDLGGKQYVEEAKAIFSYSDENNIRSFFLTIGVVTRDFYMIDNDYNVLLKFAGEEGVIMRLFNVPEKGEYDRDLLLWKYMHTCVVPLEIFHMMKNDRVEKIRINFRNYEHTIILEEKQQIALQDAVKCVEERLLATTDFIKP
jgi:hypothetical protein